MSDRVFIHLGLPKTATTYLQTILWSARDQARTDGVLLPGRERRDHLWASRVVREDPRLADKPEAHRTSWDRIAAEIADWPKTALISHEFFAAATPEQASRMVARLAPAQVHLVITAREPLGLFTASWQESLKNRHVESLADYATRVSASPEAIWNWRTLDLRLVLRRWAPRVPAERVHVLPLDTSAPREEIWHRFASLIGLDPTAYDVSGSFPNASMGVVEAETLRRVNQRLVAGARLEGAFDRGVYLRTHLADERLVPRRGEPFWPSPERIEECRERGRRAVAHLERHGYDVRGDVARLLVPDQIEPRRTPDSVTDAEVSDVALDLVARMLQDVKDQRTPPAGEEGLAARITSAATRLPRRLRRRG